MTLLTKTYKKKVRELLKKNSEIKFDTKIVEEVLQKTVERLFSYDEDKERY